MEKINFVNNTTPALNATNLNKLQQNVEDAMDESINNVVESGTWTPILKCRQNEQAPTYTTTSAYANYRKIGDLVYVEFYMKGNITQLNGTNNYILIGGLPYEQHSGGFGQQALAIGVIYDLIQTDINKNKTMCLLSDGIAIQGGDGANATQYKVTTSSYFEVAGSGFYIANVNQ